MCPVCNSDHLTIMHRFFLKQSYDVVRCSKCFLEFVNPFVLESGIKHSISTSSGYIKALKKGFDNVKKVAYVRASSRLSHYFNLMRVRPQRILEIGSATGWMVKAYNDMGVHCDGMEIDPKLVEFAQQHGITLFQKNICCIDPESMPKYDVVFSSQTLEHITQPRIALQNIRKLMQLNGILHIDVPNAHSWGARLRRYYHGSFNWGVISLPNHQFGYHARTLSTLFEECGFETLQILERPTNDKIFGQIILPSQLISKFALKLTHLLGHGYLLIGLARKS